MITPSPDRIIAAANILLADDQGNFIKELVIPLYPYDTRTDSGPDYVSANADTRPRELV